MTRGTMLTSNTVSIWWNADFFFMEAMSSLDKYTETTRQVSGECANLAHMIRDTNCVNKISKRYLQALVVAIWLECRLIMYRSKPRFETRRDVDFFLETAEIDSEDNRPCRPNCHSTSPLLWLLFHFFSFSGSCCQQFRFSWEPFHGYRGRSNTVQNTCF